MVRNINYTRISLSVNTHLVTKDDSYDPAAGNLKGQVFQGGCHQKEVVGGKGWGGGGRRLGVTGVRATSQASFGFACIVLCSVSAFSLLRYINLFMFSFWACLDIKQRGLFIRLCENVDVTCW